MPPAVAERYVARRGYANYWYNRESQQRLWRAYLQRSNMEGIGKRWRLAGSLERGDTFAMEFDEDRAEIRLPWGRSGAIFTGDVAGQLSPPRSGGLLLAIHAWQQLVDKGLDRFGEVSYLGALPHGPDDVVEDCLVGLYEGMEVRFFFSAPDGDLTGIELFAADDADPCEVAFS
ncbi:MAG TPA: serine protease, partial [Lacipirellulaceae bacterium]|nr:serine protease [Lacipirellulaceae bacterium]